MKENSKAKRNAKLGRSTETECVYVGFREYQPKIDAFVNFFSVLITGSRICHVELIFKKKCLGGVQCPWRIKKSRFGAIPCSQNRASHLVSYSIASQPGSQGVHREIDRQYQMEGAWTFLELVSLTKLQEELLESFVYFHFQKANRRGYNAYGFYCNFFLPTEFGTVLRSTKQQQQRPRRLKPRPWFCTELICAALDYGRLSMKTHPCQTMPCYLYHQLLQDKLARPVPHFGVVEHLATETDMDFPERIQRDDLSELTRLASRDLEQG